MDILVIIIYDNNMSESDISTKLKKRRLEKGLSLSQLARRANTSVATLSRYENGWQRFELSTLRKLATALGCRLRVDLEPVQEAPPKRLKASGIRDLRRLFWDRELRDRDLEDYPLWVLERVLEYGSLDDVAFVAAEMGRKRFLERVAQVRFTSARTETFWQLLLNREGVSCTKRFSRKEARPCWPG
jgi:transcriptional regulator with XRE-family HTH domain